MGPPAQKKNPNLVVSLGYLFALMVGAILASFAWWAFESEQETAQSKSVGSDLSYVDEETQGHFLDITEIIMVVDDVDASIKQQWEVFGIGPWDVWTFSPETVSDMRLHGRPENFAMKVAYTKIGNIYWEVVEPLDQRSTYYEVLKAHGPGVHNIVFEVRDYDETTRFMQENGFGIYNSGNWQGVHFANFDTRKVLPVVAEIFKTEDGVEFPKPDYTYPSASELD